MGDLIGPDIAVLRGKASSFRLLFQRAYMGRDVLHISNKLECWKEMETASLSSECVHEDPCVGKRMITLALSFFSSVRWWHVLCMAYELHEWLPIPLVFASFRHTSAPKRFFLLLAGVQTARYVTLSASLHKFPKWPGLWMQGLKSV